MHCASVSFLCNGAHTVSTTWGNLWRLHSHTDTLLRGSLAHPRGPPTSLSLLLLLFSFTFSFLVLIVSASIKFPLSVGFWVCRHCSDCMELESPPLSFASHTCVLLFVASPLLSLPPRTEPLPQPHPHLQLPSFTEAPVLSALRMSNDAPLFTLCLGCCFH